MPIRRVRYPADRRAPDPVGESLFERQQRGEPQLHSCALVADVLGLPPAAVRHWARVGWLVPARHAAGVAWFDYHQLRGARVLGRFLEAGLSLRAIDAAVASFTRPGTPPPLDHLEISGGHVCLRAGDRLLGPGGQMLLPLERSAMVDGAPTDVALLRFGADPDEPRGPNRRDGDEADGGDAVDELLALAADLDAAGEHAEAAEAFRAVLQATGPSAEVCFPLAETLFRAGDFAGARERYYATLEIEPDHVEARCGLGRVLALLGERLLALAALEGVIAQEPDYPDAHFHAAAVLRDLGHRAEAERRLRTFLTLAPVSPWASRARAWLDDA